MFFFRKIFVDFELAKGKPLSLFVDDPVFACYRYSTTGHRHGFAAAELWRLSRGRADCENRIKELKYDFDGKP